MECVAAILTSTFGKHRTPELSALSAICTLTQGNSLVLISLRGWVDPRATERRQKD